MSAYATHTLTFYPTSRQLELAEYAGYAKAGEVVEADPPIIAVYSTGSIYGVNWVTLPRLQAARLRRTPEARHELLVVAARHYWEL